MFQLCAPGDTSATELAITDEDHKVSALPGGAPLRDSIDAWSVKVALRVDMLMLEQVEALEDRVANASMQVKVRRLLHLIGVGFCIMTLAPLPLYFPHVAC